MSLSKEEIVAWGTEAAAQKKWVYHAATGVVGRVIEFYDGEEEVFFSPIDLLAVKDPVVVIEGGHSLLAKPGEVFGFVTLSQQELRFFETLRHGFKGLVLVSAKNAQSMGLELDQSLALLVAVLREQLRALEAGGT